MKKRVSRPVRRSSSPSRAARGRSSGAKRAAVSSRAYARLRQHLAEAQETLEAIRNGKVDAVVVRGEHGSQVYSLDGADRPYRVYLERMQEGAVTVSHDGLILYCNRRFAAMLQLPLARVIGAPIQPFLSAVAWGEVAGVLAAGPEVMKRESFLQPAAGPALAIHLTASPLPLSDQEIICLVVTDLTEHKMTQELQLAKDVAEKASLAKDAFLAALSHELRTPLTPVLVAATTLEQNEALPEAVRQELGMIRNNIELEARLIDDLLDLTRIAQGKLVLQPAPADLHLVLRRAVEICRADLTAKRHRLALHLDAGHATGSVDGVRLQQALWNLLRNAIKFTAPDGDISIRTHNPRAGSIVLEIRDSGMGFAPEGASLLFNAFEQGGREVTRQFGGLGLGLAITRSIVEAHGGTIEAASPGRGRGATFTVCLPLRTVSPEAAAPLPAPDPAPGRPLHILLVEDHKDTRRTLQLHLEAARHRVCAAATAEEALALAGDSTFDLVISDLGLPDEGGGLALMRELRERYQLRGIAVSGYGMEEDITHSRAAGFRHHLTKPVNLDQLKRLIAETAAPTP